MPRPVLGAQPPAPGSTTVRYVEVDDKGPSLEMVPTNAYYEEDASSSQLSYNMTSDYNSDNANHLVSMDAQTLMLIANGGFRPQKNYGRRGPSQGTPVGPCFKCQGDHWIRDCPIEQEEKGVGQNYSWPRVPRYCAACGLDHLAKDCPNKPQK